MALHDLLLLFFIPNRKKQEYLGKARKAVDYYAPKIEKRTGINFGNIKIKEFREDFLHFYEEISAKAMQYIGDNNDSIFLKTMKFQAFKLLFLWFENDSLAAYSEDNANKSIIYFPFGLRTRVNCLKLMLETRISNELKSSCDLDQVIVHELAHGLWRKIDRKERHYVDLNALDDLELIWREGFANYCDSIFFADLYPKNYKINKNSFGEDRACQEKVEKVVEAYGKQILLELPKRWKEFEVPK